MVLGEIVQHTTSWSELCNNFSTFTAFAIEFSLTDFLFLLINFVAHQENIRFLLSLSPLCTSM